MSGVGLAQVSVAVNGTQLLADVDLEVGRGEFVGVVGPNGAGKSTLLRTAAGDISATGTALLDGHPVAGTSIQELARLRAYVGPQRDSDVIFTVAEVITMGRHPWAGEARGVVSDAMKRLDVSHLAHRTVRTLSSGEQQRVAIARAVAQQTPVLLAR